VQGGMASKPDDTHQDDHKELTSYNVIILLQENDFCFTNNWRDVGRRLKISDDKRNEYGGRISTSAGSYGPCDALENCVDDWIRNNGHTSDNDGWEKFICIIAKFDQRAANNMREYLGLESVLDRLTDDILVALGPVPSGLLLHLEFELEVTNRGLMHNCSWKDVFDLLMPTLKTHKDKRIIFAKILQLFKATYSIGHRILKQETVEDFCINVSSDFRKKFDKLKESFIEMMDKVKNEIKSCNCCSLDDLKNFLNRRLRDYSEEIKKCEDIDDILSFIEKHKCSLINLTLLRAICEKHCKNAVTHVDKFNDLVNKFCSANIEMLNCTPLSFYPSHPPLKCERLTFRLRWNPKEHEFNEVRDIIEHTFKDIARDIHIKKATEGSVIVICFISHSLVAFAVYRAQQNIDFLRKSKVTKMTIGYVTVIDTNDEKSYSKSIHELKGDTEEIVAVEDKPTNVPTHMKEQVKKIKDVDVEVHDEDSEEKEIIKLMTEQNRLENIIESNSHEMQKLLDECNSKELELNKLKEEHETLLLLCSDNQKELEKVRDDYENRLQVHKRISKSKDKEIDDMKKQKEMMEEEKMKIVRARIPTVHSDWLNVNPEIVPVNITMNGFNALKKKNDIWFSPCFLSGPQGYKMCLKVQPNDSGTHVSVHVHLMVGEWDERLQWPFKGEIVVELINRKANNNHYRQTISFDDYGNQEARQRVVNGIPTNAGIINRMGQGGSNFIAHKDLDDYLKEDSIKLCVREVEVEQSILMEEVPVEPSDQWTPPEFKITKFSSQKKSNAEFRSPPFYSHEGGYKFTLLVYPNGRDTYKGRSVSAFIHIMKGENDKHLSFPFRGEFIVQIVNVKEDKNHVEQKIVFTDENDPKGTYGGRVSGVVGFLGSNRAVSGFGIPDFLSHEHLEHHQAQYIKDDSITFRISKITVSNTAL
jgi:hypothetical protein